MIFSKNKLLSCFFENEEATHRLFCFPSAGGDSTMFRDWYQYLPDTEVWGVTYPGRGALAQQPFSENFGTLVRNLMDEVLLYKDKPFIFFGHSFGALLSYAISLELMHKQIQPDGMLVCARRCPQALDRHGFSKMSQQQVLEKLLVMNSIPLAIAESQELLEFYLNIIIKDLCLNETVIDVSNASLNVPLYIYSGVNDEFVQVNEMKGWEDVTKANRTFREFPGDHFFISNNKETFLDQMSQDVEYLQGIDDDSVAY